LRHGFAAQQDVDAKARAEEKNSGRVALGCEWIARGGSELKGRTISRSSTRFRMTFVLPRILLVVGRRESEIVRACDAGRAAFERLRALASRTEARTIEISVGAVFRA
jgi:hypothetical protein